MKITLRRAIGRLTVVGTACVLAAGTGALMGASSAQATRVMPGCPTAVVSGASATVTCTYTGAAQYWTVPAGVTQATFTLYGGAGGTINNGSGPGGSGAEVTGTLPVTPGSVLQVNVGQAGESSGAAFGGGGPGGGFSGSGFSGGGGASDIRDGGYTLADRLLVAGGGGGGGGDGDGTCVAGGDAGGCFAAGGAGGDAGSAGEAGASTLGVCGETLSGGGGGAAGTATMGGAGGAGNTSGNDCGGNSTPPDGAAGSEGGGGAAGESANGAYGAGGGGGYYGGGGGAGGTWDSDGDDAGTGGGGGGGSSYTGTAAGASVNDDPASPPGGGNGEVIITYRPVLAVTSHSLSGHETAVSCMTASRCVAVGSRGGRAVVVTLANGAQSHAAVLTGSPVLTSVSCPTASGCWAIGHPDHGAGAYLVKISSAGRPAAERTVTLPTGTSMSVISCASMTSCQVAGANNRLVGAKNRVRPAAIEISTWNGTRLHLYRIPVAGSTQVSMTGISCWHSDCAAVGSVVAGTASPDLIQMTTGGKPATLNVDSGYALRGISCISATTCYAAGAAVLVTVTSGVPADVQAVAGGWSGRAIECTGGQCEAAGGEVFGSANADVLVSLTGGTAGSPVIVQLGQGFTGIAARGSSGFIAIAPSGTRTAVTIG
jgi:hypothetical protein